MNDKEFAKQKRRVLAFFRKWKHCTGLQQWHVCHHWVRDAQPRDDHGYSSDAHTEIRWDYCSADFYWNVAEWIDFPDHVAERLVRHEICHVLINEMREWGGGSTIEAKVAHEERVVTELASVLRWCRDQGRSDARRRPSARRTRGKRLS